MRTDTQSSRHIGRSIGAVLAGFIVVVILSIGTDLLLHAIGILPRLGDQVSDSLLLVATIYRTIYSIAGSYVTAWLAPNRPMKHALAGGVVGLVIGTVGAITTWNGAGMGHHWYSIALAVLALPCAWVGGKLRSAQSQVQIAS
jgi:hypothetical protein